MDIPVAIFAYNRPYHTLKTLNSLSKNSESKNTDLYAFIDGHKKNSEIQLIDNVEKIIKSFHNKFKSVNIQRSNINLTGGMNQKIGITKVLSLHEAVISLEDDINVSKYFLAYMRNALNLYKNKKEIWHISGFNYPVTIDGNLECFFTRLPCVWGWGTWRDRWNDFIENPLSCDPYYLKEIFTKNMIYEFNLRIKTNPFWSHVEDNALGKLNNTWDIFWYCHIFLNNGLCLSPKTSLTRNIGHDGSGIHTCFDKELLSLKINEKKIINLPHDIQENLDFFKSIRSYYKRKNGIKSILKNKLNNIINFLKEKFFNKFI